MIKIIAKYQQILAGVIALPHTSGHSPHQERPHSMTGDTPPHIFTHIISPWGDAAFLLFAAMGGVYLISFISILIFLMSKERFFLLFSAGHWWVGGVLIFLIHNIGTGATHNTDA